MNSPLNVHDKMTANPNEIPTYGELLVFIEQLERKIEALSKRVGVLSGDKRELKSRVKCLEAMGYTGE